MAEPMDLRDLLDAPGTSFPDRPSLPGSKTFYGKLLSVEATHSQVKGTPAFRFNVRLTDPGSDVPKPALDAITGAGFNLSDYQVYYDFWLTPGSMSMLWRFLEGGGFDRNKGLREQMKLDDSYNPTADTNDLFRGMDIICRTQQANDQGRVFSNLDMIAFRKAA